MTNSTFTTDLKNQIIDRLNDYADGSYYASDLSCTLFEGENVNGSVFCNTYKTKEFIKENFDLFGDLVQHCKDSMDMTLNPFAEPEKAHVILLLESSSEVLSRLPFIDGNWNEKIELNANNIALIVEQLNELDIADSDLF